MKFIYPVIFSIFFSQISLYSQNDTLKYWVNLKSAPNNRLNVTAELPTSESQNSIWQMPAIVPGTYKVYDFGRFVSNFDAYDSQGTKLNVEIPDSNSRRFNTNGKKSNIQYTVNHTWDFTGDGKTVFYPAGTRFIQDEVFLFNAYAALGYIQGKIEIPIRVYFILPDSFYAGTASEIFSITEDTISFVYHNYHELADNPILFSKPETAVLRFDDTQILISIYDPNHIVSAKKISEKLKVILDAQQQYLGGQLPVKKYAFLIYIDPDFDLFGSFGALEHNYCSTYYLPAMEADWIFEQIRDIGAHEFFHIVTPLTLHSEQIHNFNYQNPELSQHLWLYEGVTEYSASLVQVQYDLITEKQFLETLREKIKESANYRNDISFVDLSLGCLDTFEDQYQNVYEKGALIGMCLDLTLRKHTQNNSGIADLLKKLSTDFGKDKPFQDTALFTIIEKNTVPEVGAFLRECVAGTKDLPIQDVLAYAGYAYFPEKMVQGFTLGGVELSMNTETGRLVVWETSGMDAFGKKIGYKTGDEFLKINGIEITMDNLESTFTDFFNHLKVGDHVNLELLRTKKNGKTKVIKASANMLMVSYTENNVIESMENLNAEQISIRKAWINK